MNDGECRKLLVEIKSSNENLLRENLQLRIRIAQLEIELKSISKESGIPSKIMFE
jgi:cell division septum initiation protein DivIVA